MTNKTTMQKRTVCIALIVLLFAFVTIVAIAGLHMPAQTAYAYSVSDTFTQGNSYTFSESVYFYDEVSESPVALSGELSYTGTNKESNYVIFYFFNMSTETMYSFRALYGDAESVPNSFVIIGGSGTSGDPFNINFANRTAPHIHKGATFTAWESNNSLPTAAGSYYLTQDVTLDGRWNVPAGTINLCLDGHTVTQTADDCAFYVGTGNTMNLYDVESNQGTVTGGKGYNYASSIRSGGNIFVKGAFNMYGGTVTGGFAKEGGGISVYGGSFTMNGGEISGNATDLTDSDEGSGGGIGAFQGSTVTINNGTITNNQALFGGGLYGFDASIVNLAGGSITGNTAEYGGGVCVWSDNPSQVTLNLTGSEITNNTAIEGGGILNAFGILNLIGGTVSGNTVSAGCGAGLKSFHKSSGMDAEVNLSGTVFGEDDVIAVSPHVTDTSAKPINITGDLGSRVYKIRLYTNGRTKTTPVTGDVTNGLSGYGTLANFVSDNGDGFALILDGNGEAEYILGHQHNDILFTAWTSNSSLPTEAGSYYLTQDVVMSNDWQVGQYGVSDFIMNLCLNGYSISFGKYYAYVEIKYGATLNLYDCGTSTRYITLDDSSYFESVSATPSEGSIPVVGGFIGGSLGTVITAYTNNINTFNMYGGNIVGNAGGLGMNGPSSFNMHGGKICYNKQGVNVGKGTFTMYGGLIANNNFNYNGAGGVYVSGNGATFIMNGGEISYNTSAQKGGGVYVYDIYGNGNVHFVMNDGTIGYNSSANGGGVYVYGGEFVLNDGEISHNTATNDGGGVFIYNDDDDHVGVFDMNGGSITNNTAGENGGGLLTMNDITISGDAVISNNTAGTGNVANNLYLGIGCTADLEADDALTTGASIGVSMEKAGVFTDDFGEDNKAYFTADDPEDYDILITDYGALKLHYNKPHVHDYSSDWRNDDDQHWYDCNGKGDCDEPKGSLGDHVYSEDEHQKAYYICSVCGYLNSARKTEYDESNHVHYYEYDWSYDASNHWKNCINTNYCDGSEYGNAAHTYSESTDTADYFTCTVCGYVNLERVGAYNEANAGSEAHATHTHDEITFDTAWNNDSALPTVAGAYYLTTDVTLDRDVQWEISADIKLCLNGHKIMIEWCDYQNNIHITESGSLTICDHDKTAHTFELNEYRVACNIDTATAVDSKVFIGGCILGGKYTSGSNRGPILVEGAFVMNGGTIVGMDAGSHEVYSFGSPVNVIGGTFTMNGGNIVGNSGYSGGVFVYSTDSEHESTFVINGGVIAYNSANYHEACGGGVYVRGQYASFTMNGGFIKDNMATDGAGVNIKGGATVVINEGDICGNKTSRTYGYAMGAGIFVQDNSSLTVNGGRIQGNIAGSAGGGIASWDAASIVTINGGLIADNTASSGGGIMSYGVLTLNDGTVITRNRANFQSGGVGTSKGMSVSGEVIIDGNTLLTTSTGEASDYYFGGGSQIIQFDEPLTGNSHIGIIMYNPDCGDPFTSDDADAYIGFFSAQNEGYIVAVGANNALRFISHVHEFSYEVDGATITATCSVEGCPLTDGKAMLTINAPTGDMVYDGTAKVATLSSYDASVFAPEAIKYYKGGQEVASCIAAGTYVAKVTSNGKTAEVEFTISPLSFADYNLTLSTDTLTYTGEEQSVAATVLHKDGGIPLQEGTHYTLSGQKATEVGEYTLTITGIGNYSGTKTATYHVVPANIEGMGIDAPEGGFDENYIYAVTPWTTTNIHYWGNVNGGEYVTWPGVQMESLGNGLFRYPYPALKNDDTAVYLIFDTNEGSEQTADLKDSKEVALGSVYFVTAKQPGQPHAATIFKSRDQQRAVVTLMTNSADVTSVVFAGNTLTVDVDYTVSYKTSGGDAITKPVVPGDYIAVVTGTGSYTGSVEKAFALRHEHSLTYTVNGATITATCSADGCPLTDKKATLTINAPTGDMVYDGTAKVATLSSYDASVFAPEAIKYYKGGQEVASCVNAGTYVAKVTSNGKTAEVEFVIAKADLAESDYTIPTGLEAVYGDDLADVDLPAGWAWVTSSDKVGNVGNRQHNATFTPEDSVNYNGVTKQLTVAVAKAIPDCTVPTGLTSLVDKTLDTVALPAGWTWNAPETNVGNEEGAKTFKATFTPADTDNYEIVENVDVTVNVYTHAHAFAYTANGATITATCGNEDCYITEGLTITLVAPTGDMVYDGNARVATIQAGYNVEAFPNAAIVYYKGDTVVTSCVAAGTYTAKVTFGNATASVDFTIENWTLTDDSDPETPEKQDVTVEIKGAEVDESVQLKVEVKAAIATEEAQGDYTEAVKEKIAEKEEVAIVYEVKLLRLTVVGGQETLEEIQPSEIKEGATITITMKIPEELKGKDFRVLHIHNAGDVSEVNYTLSASGDYISVETDRLSEFAFLVEKAEGGNGSGENEGGKTACHGFCIGWVVFIFVMLELLYFALYFILWFPKAAFLVEKCHLTALTPKRCLLGKIGSAVACAIFIFALVALCVHQCAVTIVSFILALLILAAFCVIFYIEHKELVKEWIYKLRGKKYEKPVEKTKPAEETILTAAVTEETNTGFYRITKDEAGKCTFALFYTAKDNLSKEMGVFDSEKEAQAAIQALRTKGVGVKAENRIRHSGESIPAPKFVLEEDAQGVYRYSFLDEDGTVLLQSVQYLNERRCLADLKCALICITTGEVSVVNGALAADEIEAVEPVDEMLAEESTLEASPAEEAAAEETPVEETPAEETPAEEAPVEETSMEDVSEEVAEEAAEEVAATESEEDRPEDDHAEDETPEEDPNAGVSLKENIEIARATVSHSKINKQYVADYLHLKYDKNVVLNRRGNETKTGLPLADTHYAVGEEKNVCFVYVYEVEGTTMLLVKVSDEYGAALAEKHPIVKRSAFPKSRSPWYSVIVDDSFTAEEVEKILDDAYLMNGGSKAKDEGLSLKETLAMAKATVSHLDRTKKGIADFLKDAFGESAEINCRGNKTRTGLPLADTHYAVKGEEKACFVYVYEVGTVALLIRLPEDYAAQVMNQHSTMKRSAFPKAPHAWYSVILTDDFSDDEVNEMLKVGHDSVL